MAYSRQTAVSNGTLQVLDITLQFMKRGDLSVLVDGVLTTEWSWVGSLNTITFPAPLANGVVVTLVRRTQSDKVIHVFGLGASFTSSSMDTDFRQMLYLAQEYTEGAGFTDIFNNLNMNGYRIVNVGNPVNPTDAVNLQSMNTEYAGITAIANNALAVASAADAKAEGAKEALYRAGAIGDGVANDTAAVLFCLNTYGVCWLPDDGKFLVSGLTIPAGTMITGPGTLVGAGNATPMATLLAGAVVAGTTIDTRGNTYGFILSGKGSSVTVNRFKGDVGHYTYSGAPDTTVSHNSVSAGYNQTTPFVFVAANDFACDSNTLEDTTGFGISTRFLRGGSIMANTFRQAPVRSVVTAYADQTVYIYTLPVAVARYGIQVNGAPKSTGLTIVASNGNKTFTVTLTAGQPVGTVVELFGYRALENVNINSQTYDVRVADNYMNGTGDSGIVIGCDYHNGVLDPNNVTPADFPARIAVRNNQVIGAAYAGIAMTHGAPECSFTGNSVADCGMITEDQSYSSGIFVSGPYAVVDGNTLSNTLPVPTMKYGIVMGANYTSEKFRPVAQVGVNSYTGTFTERLFITNQTPGKRKQGISLSGDSVNYPGSVNTDTAFSNRPADTPFFTYTHSGTGVIYDTTTKLGGTGSLQTAAGAYVNVQPTAMTMLDRHIMRVDFWAKAVSGLSYAQIYSTLALATNAVTLEITDTVWKHYSIWFPVTAGLDVPTIFIRFGANTGSANIQHIQITGVAIP